MMPSFILGITRLRSGFLGDLSSALRKYDEKKLKNKIRKVFIWSYFLLFDPEIGFRSAFSRILNFSILATFTALMFPSEPFS